MRIVLRLVVQELFNRFSRPCYEYLESDTYQGNPLSCVDVGFSTPIFHLVWWSSKLEDTLTFEQFTKGNTKSNWSKQMDALLFKNGKRREGIWVKNNGDWLIKDKAVEDFFKFEFFKERGAATSYPSKFPVGDGGTSPSYGMNEWNRILKDEIFGKALTEKQKLNSEFPTFLMTDGEVNGRSEPTKMETERDNLKKITSKAKTYGLGLTGSSGLKTKQINLYKKLNYDISTTLPSGKVVEHFFSTEESARDMVNAILTRIDNCDRICYQPPRVFGQPDKEPVCLPESAPPPDFGGGKVTVKIPDETQTTLSTADATLVKVTKRTNEVEEYVTFTGNPKVYKIPVSTELCQSYPNKRPELKSSPYDKDGKCECCKTDPPTAPGKCLCDYRTTTPISESTEEVGDTKASRIVKEYSPQSRLAFEIGEVVKKSDVFTVVELEETVDGEDTSGNTGGDATPGSGTPGSGTPDVIPDPPTTDDPADPVKPTSGGVTATLSSLALLPSFFFCLLRFSV